MNPLTSPFTAIRVLTDYLAVDRSYSLALVALLLGLISVLRFAPYSIPLLPPLALALLLLY